MRELKPLSRDAVDAALAKAERYRFLNEPGEAESICLDILTVDAGSGPYAVVDWLGIYGVHAHDHADQIRRARATVAS